MRDGAFSGPEASAPPENPARNRQRWALGSGPRQLVAIIDAERAAHAVRMNELEGILVAERDAFVARIRSSKGRWVSERAPMALRSQTCRQRFDAERQAAVARILGARSDAQSRARRVCRPDQRALKGRGQRAGCYGTLIANLRATSDAERPGAVARIRELEATLKAEHEAFVAGSGSSKDVEVLRSASMARDFGCRASGWPMVADVQALSSGCRKRLLANAKEDP
jgi:hypothetical protein